MITFVAWAAYGIIPTLHWYLEMGGVESQMVKVSFNMSGLSLMRRFFFLPFRSCTQKPGTMCDDNESLKKSYVIMHMGIFFFYYILMFLAYKYMKHETRSYYIKTK
jgi:hypothetical protein